MTGRSRSSADPSGLLPRPGERRIIPEEVDGDLGLERLGVRAGARDRCEDLARQAPAQVPQVSVAAVEALHDLEAAPAGRPLLGRDRLEPIAADRAAEELDRQVGAQAVAIAGRRDQHVAGLDPETRIAIRTPPVQPRRALEHEHDDRKRRGEVEEVLDAALEEDAVHAVPPDGGGRGHDRLTLRGHPRHPRPRGCRLFTEAGCPSGRLSVGEPGPGRSTHGPPRLPKKPAMPSQDIMERSPVQWA